MRSWRVDQPHSATFITSTGRPCCSRRVSSTRGNASSRPDLRAERHAVPEHRDAADEVGLLVGPRAVAQAVPVELLPRRPARGVRLHHVEAARHLLVPVPDVVGDLRARGAPPLHEPRRALDEGGEGDAHADAEREVDRGRALRRDSASSRRPPRAVRGRSAPSESPARTAGRTTRTRSTRPSTARCAAGCAGARRPSAAPRARRRRPCSAGRAATSRGRAAPGPASRPWSARRAATRPASEPSATIRRSSVSVSLVTSTQPRRSASSGSRCGGSSGASRAS